MLQQILTNMYIDPDILEALNDEQKKTLFLKMREEQVRRWKEREENEAKEEKEGRIEKPKSRKSTFKKVSWLLGRDGDVHVCVIGETDEFKSSKLLLSDFREKKTNLNATNRPQTTGHLKSSVDVQGKQKDSNKPGIELLLSKADEMNHLITPLPDIHSRSTEELKNQTDDATNLITPKSYKTNQQPPPGASRASRLNQFDLQKNTVERDAQEKEMTSEQGRCAPVGSRVAQLRMNFNTPNTKPPIPTKPSHLLTTASVR